MATGGCIKAATKKTGKTAFQREFLYKRSRRTGSSSGNSGGEGDGDCGGGGGGGGGGGVDGGRCGEVAVGIRSLLYPGNCWRRQKLFLPLQLFLMTIVSTAAAPMPMPIDMTPTTARATSTTATATAIIIPTTALTNEGSVRAYEAGTIYTPAATTTTTTAIATTTNSFGAGGGGSAILAATTTAAAAAVSSLHLRKRHRKRNSNWYDYYNFNENTTALEWANPCGGFYVPTPDYQQRRRKNQKQIYNLLKRAAGNEFRTLNSSQEDIDISNIKIWFLHDYNYKFLPKLKINSTIALKRWYRNMQTYVASFAFLRRVQLNWDRRHPKHESRTARELKHLLLSSRSMLCELETAVNNTYPVRSISSISSNGNNGYKKVYSGGNGYFSSGGSGGSGIVQRRQLQQITRAQMNKRLKLRTKRRNAASDDVNSDVADVHEADSIDLRFVKYYYYEFLKAMWKLLRQNTKRQGQQQREQHQLHQQRRRQQQQQPQSQQQQHQQHQQSHLQRQQNQQQKQQNRHRQRQRLTANRKEFNEVEKPMMAIAGNNGVSVNIDKIGVVRGRGVGGSSNIARSNKKHRHEKRSNLQTALAGLTITTTTTTTSTSSTTLI